MPKPVTKHENEDTKDRILSAATEVFGEAGYYNATMTKIAEQARVAKGTLYWYFSSKEELFQGIIETGFAKFYSRLKVVLNNNRLDPKEKLYRFVQEYLKFFSDQQHLSKVVSTEVLGLSGEFHRKMLDWQVKFIQINTDLVSSGVQSGLFRSELDPQQVALMFSGVLSAIGSPHFLIKEDLNEKAEVEFIYNLMLHGIAE